MGYFARLGESWGLKTDTWWPATLATIGGVMALGGPYIGQLSGSRTGQSIGLLVGIIGVLCAAISPVYETFRHRAELASAIEESNKAKAETQELVISTKIETRQNFLLMTEWTLTPLLMKLTEVLSYKRGSRRRETSAAEFRLHVLSIAKELVSSDSTNIRANYFKLEWLATGSAVLRATGSTSFPPRDLFSEETEEGRAVFDMLAQNGHRFCADVDEFPPPGWDEAIVRNYKTFISITVQGFEEPIGMLTVDAANPGDLDESDVALLRLLGTILAISEDYT